MKVKVVHPKTLGVVLSFILLAFVFIILLVVDLLFLVSRHK